MKNVSRIYKIVLHHWIFLIFGLIFMIGFALFSGVSVMMAIPLLDYVFKSDQSQVLYTNFPAFSEAVKENYLKFVSQQESIFALFDKANYEPFLKQLGSILKQTDPVFLLWMIGIIVIILIILKNIFYFGNRLMFINLRGKSTLDLRNLMFRKYLYQSHAFFQKNKVGDSIVRLNSDVNIINTFFIHSQFNILTNGVMLIVYAVIALLLNLKLFLISLVLFPVFSLLVSFIGGKIKKYSQKIQQQSSNLFSKVEEILNSMKIVKAFTREEFEFKKFSKINVKQFRFWRRSENYHSVNTSISEITSTVTGIVVLLIGGKQVLSGDSEFTFGIFIAFILAIFSMLYPLKILTKAYANIRKALVSIERVSEILNRKETIVESKSQIRKENFQDKIQLQEVYFQYDENKEILKDISFEITKGEKIAIVGSSGSGKTTLVNLLPRMYDIKSGKILIDGISIKDINLKDLRNLFGIVTQESILFTDSIKNNISYGTLKQVSQNEIEDAAHIAFADEFIETLPEQYNHFLHPKASNLSGGQKQRLCIARAIVGNPPILIFDEATSALDTEAERKVQKAIEQATKNRTVIVIAHRLSTVLSSDKIIVLDHGKIVGSGHHKELLETCERYKTLYDLQFNH